MNRKQILPFLLSVMTASPVFAGSSDRFDEKQEDVPGVSSILVDGLYIVPNEHEFYLFEPSLKGRTGGLMAVGTFRALEAASRGEFSRLFMIDVDPGVVAFNRLQIQALKDSQTPGMFLAHLFGQPELASQFDNLLANPDPVSNLYSLFGVNSFLERPKFSTPKVFEYVEKLLSYQMSHDQAKRSFLASTDRFTRLRNMALNGQIEVVRVDLAGRALAAFGHYLKDIGHKISVIDISNAPEFFLKVKWPLQPGFGQMYLKNLEAIPFERDAVVHFTSRKKQLWENISDWHYHSVSVADHKRAVKRIVAEPLVTTYKDYVASLLQRDHECESGLISTKAWP